MQPTPKLAILALTLLTSALTHAALPVGEPAPVLSLQGEQGGLLDGSPWSSTQLRGKIHLVVYSNVSARDLNADATKAIKEANFPRDKFASIAVINIGGSWQPTFMINSALEAKQKEFPDTLYVKDLQKTLVNTWNLKDESNDMVLFDTDGKVLFSVDGKLAPKDIALLVTTIKAKIGATPSAATPSAATPSAATPSTATPSR